jgi:hypothetical protein
MADSQQESPFHQRQCIVRVCASLKHVLWLLFFHTQITTVLGSWGIALVENYIELLLNDIIGNTDSLLLAPDYLHAELSCNVLQGTCVCVCVCVCVCRQVVWIIHFEMLAQHFWTLMHGDDCLRHHLVGDGSNNCVHREHASQSMCAQGSDLIAI